MKIHGIKYQAGMVVRIKKIPGHIVYCQLQDIYLVKDHNIFKSEQMNVVEYMEAIKLSFPNEIIMFVFENFTSHATLTIRCKDNEAFIVDNLFWMKI